MIGPATLFVVRDRVVQRLAAEPALGEVLDSLTSQPSFSYFGVLGLNLFDFVPASSPPGNPSLGAYADIWRALFDLLTLNNVPMSDFEEAEIQDPVQRADNNVLAILNRTRSLLGQAQQIANDEKLFKLKDLQEELERAAGDDLRRLKLLQDLLTSGDLLEQIRNLIATEMRPAATPAGAAPASIPPLSQWPPRESVWVAKTGAFADALLRRARENGNPQFLAYAFGFHLSFVTQVTGAPYLNSIVGSTPRLHWWRARWVARYIDAWVWGFYHPDQDQTTPPFDYSSWRSLCDAELHNRLKIGELDGADPLDVMQRVVRNQALPNALDPAFRTLWLSCFTEVYGSDGHFGLVDGDRLNTALVWTWLTLWFTTSRKSLSCNPAPPMSLADGTAFFDPHTVNPFLPDEVEEKYEESEQDPFDIQPEFVPDRRRTACGAILAILGFLEALLGLLLTGLGALAGGILLIIRGEFEIDWKKLRQDLYVLRWALYNNVDGMYRMLLYSGLAYPHGPELAAAETRVVIPNNPDVDFQSGEILVRSRARLFDFPSVAWLADASEWTTPPSSAAADIEQPPTIGYGAQDFPSFFVDRGISPVPNGSVRDFFVFPPQGAPPVTFLVFGNAVDGCIESLKRLDEDLPNLNLSGDRGLGFRAWRFADDVYSNPVNIEPAD